MLKAVQISVEICPFLQDLSDGSGIDTDKHGVLLFRSGRRIEMVR